MAQALTELAAAIRSIRPLGQRTIVGICGAPGAGKTTVARTLVAELGTTAANVPMDGFHLADVTLDDLGIRDRKGAPETFDRHGYARLLATLAARLDHTVYAPGFERDIEQPIAGAIAIEQSVDVVITEGNYLLLDGWESVRDALDEVWFVRENDALRRERLIARHIEFGKSLDAATAWVERVDDANAHLIEATAARADRVVELSAESSVRSSGE
ncbi:nucleoside/nucleotide kinase family protein [Paramicrobacterium agarici]|uniref:Phosphoribulokinase/uridine kinase family protein n=1 Tax=Paramicrobacterium agarici TaxID=630514 RepID=A0A2A9DUT6_9MICO|nr:nucleoside/nucleotide kinase family protein [Microbacterium agarici]PFG30136.1 phosphoribulokinase/uridine kinase family protein [Microbacterium agarici]